MKLKFVALCIAVGLITTVASAQTDTTFTYQGELRQNGSPANGLFNSRFSLWDAIVGGTQIGTTDVHNGVPVVDGKFTVELDFGANAFDNANRWLNVIVNLSQLSPRQPVARSPYAIQTRGIFVDEDGDVDIGIDGTAGQQSLYVNGAIEANGAVTADTNFLLKGNQPGDIAIIDHLNFDLNLRNLEGAGDISFWLKNSDGINVNTLTIKPDGKVGIGTSAPETRLHLTGSESIMQTTTSSSGAGTWIELENTSTGGERWGIVSTGAENGEGAGKMLLRSISDGHTVMALEGSGNVGIGTSNPRQPYKLDVIGEDVAVHGSGEIGVVGAGEIGVVGQTSSGSGVRGIANDHEGIGVYGWSTTTDGFDFYAAGPGQDYGSSSSRRWKSNIKAIDSPLKKITQLRGVYFDWDQEHGGHHGIGMIAEEVGGVLPEIVQFEKNGIDASGMDYSKLTPLLVESVKALQAQNVALRACLESLEPKNREMQQQILELQRLMEQLTAKTEEASK